MKRLAKSLLLGIIVGTIVALLISSAAIDHNPQHEFVTEAGQYTEDLYAVFLSWFIVAGGTVFVCSLIFGYLFRSRD